MYRKFINIFSFLSAFLPQLAFGEVNIAVIAPKEGEFQRLGSEIIEGVKIGVSEINSNGGLNGEKINLITVDDQCNDRLAISTAQMMALNSSSKDKMNLVIGPYCSNAFQQVADVYAKAGIFQIIPTSISAQTAKGSNYKGLVKLVGFSESQGRDFFNFFKKHFSGLNLAMVYDSEQPDSISVAKIVQSEFVSSSIPGNFLVYNLAEYKNDEDILAQDILDDGGQAAYILGNPQRVAKLARYLKEEKRKFTIFTNRYQSQASYDEILGSLSEGAYVIGLPSLKDNPDFTETLVNLRLRGIEPQGLAVYGYSAVKLWEKLVQKADSFSYAKLSNLINKEKVDLVWGETMFTNGNPNKSISYSIYQIRNGEYTQVY